MNIKNSNLLNDDTDLPELMEVLAESSYHIDNWSGDIPILSVIVDDYKIEAVINHNCLYVSYSYKGNFSYNREKINNWSVSLKYNYSLLDKSIKQILNNYKKFKLIC